MLELVCVYLCVKRFWRPELQCRDRNNPTLGECSNVQVITSITSSVWTGWLTRGSGRRLGVDVAMSGLYLFIDVARQEHLV